MLNKILRGGIWGKVDGAWREGGGMESLVGLIGF